MEPREENGTEDKIRHPPRRDDKTHFPAWQSLRRPCESGKDLSQGRKQARGGHGRRDDLGKHALGFASRSHRRLFIGALTNCDWTPESKGNRELQNLSIRVDTSPSSLLKILEKQRTFVERSCEDTSMYLDRFWLADRRGKNLDHTKIPAYIPGNVTSGHLSWLEGVAQLQLHSMTYILFIMST